MEKEDRIIEILAWICILAIIVFCIRFNYELKHDTWVVADDTQVSYNLEI